MSRRHLSWKVKRDVDALCILWFMLFMFLVIVQQNYSFIIQTDYQLWFQNKSKTWVNKWSCLAHLIIRATEQNIICTEKAGHENTESMHLWQIFSSTQSQIPASFPIPLWKQWDKWIFFFSLVDEYLLVTFHAKIIEKCFQKLFCGSSVTCCALSEWEGCGEAVVLVHLRLDVTGNSF